MLTRCFKLLTLCLTAFAAFSGWSGSAAARERLVGVPTVIDGDTLEIRGQRIRLHGVDAPESRQLCQIGGKPVRCGQQAALALDSLINRRPVECRAKDQDRYGRIVAVCFLGQANLNSWLVSTGHALAYRQYAADYVAQENEARTARRGVWAGQFDYPWDWRKQQRSGKNRTPAVGKTAQPSSGCRIKGNISADGERIYHRPGGRHYAKVDIDTSKGERWFCSDREAVAAGWRPSHS